MIEHKEFGELSVSAVLEHPLLKVWNVVHFQRSDKWNLHSKTSMGSRAVKAYEDSVIYGNPLGHFCLTFEAVFVVFIASLHLARTSSNGITVHQVSCTRWIAFVEALLVKISELLILIIQSISFVVIFWALLVWLLFRLVLHLHWMAIHVFTILGVQAEPLWITGGVWRRSYACWGLVAMSLRYPHVSWFLIDTGSTIGSKFHI